MKQILVRTYLLTSLIVTLLLGYVALSNRPVKADSKLSYKVDSVWEGQIQQTLDQRSADGWELVSISAFPVNPQHPTAVLIFKK